VFVRDVGFGSALFGEFRGDGVCGAVACLGVCSRGEHCALGLARSRLLLARARDLRLIRRKRLNQKEGGNENGSQN